MSKSFSAAKPQRFVVYDNERTLVSYNVVEKEGEENLYEFDTIVIKGEPTKENLVNSLLREKYSQSEVEAIMRHKLNGDAGADTEFAAFNAFAEECKSIANAILSE